MALSSKSRQEILLEIKTGALLLQHNLSSHLVGEALYAQMEYEQLVERFQFECQRWWSGEDCRAAKHDFDAFIRMLDAAIEREGRASIPSEES